MPAGIGFSATYSLKGTIVKVLNMWDIHHVATTGKGDSEQ